MQALTIFYRATIIGHSPAEWEQKSEVPEASLLVFQSIFRVMRASVGDAQGLFPE